MNPDLPYLHQPEGVTDWSPWPVPSPQITKMVIGKLDETHSGTQLPGDFAERFPNLKLLHLWGLEGVRELPDLPLDLVELDVRECSDLESLPELPEGLEVLVVGEVPKLRKLEQSSCGACLVDVAITDCPELEEDSLLKLLGASIKLAELDFSGCASLSSLPGPLPESLVDLKVNRCSALNVLPEYWPGNLRRLELAETGVGPSLPEFPYELDYVNLSGCRNLKAIPQSWIHGSHLKSLFLYGSSIQEPPAPQHGENEEENVSEKTRKYFQEMELVGEGEVKRCKVLLIGNGHAGKTTLNLALRGKDPKKDNPGSTHGIQFEPWPLCRVVDGQNKTLLRHLWDFGGQEIYHNTHQLFMKTGAIFVLLWDPTQDGKQPDPTEEGYVDEWRRLRYWLDYLKLYGPRAPRVAVVCNCRPELEGKTSGPFELSNAKRDELKKEFEKQSDGCEIKPALFFADPFEEKGELAKINDWIESEVIEVIQTQGSSVPAYWEVAQDMVEGWVEQESPKELAFHEFQQELQERLDRIVKTPGKFHRLANAIRSSKFSLNPERISSTLGFLTNSGWIYWDEDLFHERVIISQRWALEAIYAALDRRPGQEIFKTLTENEGRFTKETLEKTAWGELNLTGSQEDLLLSYMEQIGTCFTLIQAEDRWRHDPIYVSLTHLKTVAEQGWETTLYGNHELSLKMPVQISNDWLHEGHWHQILAILGKTYGREGHYAKDGFFLEDPNGQTVLLRMVLGEKKIGGHLEFTVHAKTDEEAKKIEARLFELIEGLLPRVAGRPPRKEVQIGEPAGPVFRRIRVFVSYAWNPRRADLQKLPKGLVEDMTEAEVPDYEGPVDAIEEAFKDEDAVVLLRDKHEIEAKDSVMKFIKQVQTCDRVMVFHSKKYWRSPYCLFEFCRTWERFSREKKMIEDTFILVGLKDSGVFESEHYITRYLQDWSKWELSYQRLDNGELNDDEIDNLKCLPTRLTKHWPRNELFHDVKSIFLKCIPELHQMSDYGKRWSEETKDEVIEWIRGEIGLKPPSPKA